MNIGDSLKRLGQQWLAVLVCGVVVLVFLVANMSSQVDLYPLQVFMDKVLILVFGGAYQVVRPLPDGLALMILLVITWIFITLVWHLIRRRRWPTLLPVLLLFGVNCLVFSAPGLIFSRSVGDAVQDCELFVTPQTGLRVVRYPVDVRLDYAEQQFFLITHDGGQNWSQFAQTFVYYPNFLGCMHFDFEADGRKGNVYIEQSDRVGVSDTLIYHTEDGGLTWQIMEDDE